MSSLNQEIKLTQRIKTRARSKSLCRAQSFKVPVFLKKIAPSKGQSGLLSAIKLTENESPIVKKVEETSAIIKTDNQLDNSTTSSNESPTSNSSAEIYFPINHDPVEEDEISSDHSIAVSSDNISVEESELEEFSSVVVDVKNTLVISNKTSKASENQHSSPNSDNEDLMFKIDEEIIYSSENEVPNEMSNNISNSIPKTILNSTPNTILNSTPNTTSNTPKLNQKKTNHAEHKSTNQNIEEASQSKQSSKKAVVELTAEEKKAKKHSKGFSKKKKKLKEFHTSFNMYETEKQELSAERAKLKRDIQKKETEIDELIQDYTQKRKALKQKISIKNKLERANSNTSQYLKNQDRFRKKKELRNELKLLRAQRNKMANLYDSKIAGKELQLQEMQDRFYQVLSKLEHVKQKLQHVTLHGRHVHMMKPGPNGYVALVFTDIEGSTRLWECNTKLMSRAIEIHNQIVRKLLIKYQGYEVKTEGDAFMCAFQDVYLAAMFSLAVHQFMLRAKWPKSLLQFEHAKEVTGNDGSVLFRGLRVRIGIHCGKPIVTTDETTLRNDYFGPVVNKAARISNEAAGGLTMVSKDVWKVIKEARKKNVEPPIEYSMRYIGAVKLKGISDPAQLRLVVPQELVGRLEVGRKESVSEKRLRNLKRNYEKSKSKEKVLSKKLKDAKEQFETESSAKTSEIHRLRAHISKMSEQIATLKREKEVMCSEQRFSNMKKVSQNSHDKWNTHGKWKSPKKKGKLNALKMMTKKTFSLSKSASSNGIMIISGSPPHEGLKVTNEALKKLERSSSEMSNNKNDYETKGSSQEHNKKSNTLSQNVTQSINLSPPIKSIGYPNNAQPVRVGRKRSHSTIVRTLPPIHGGLQQSPLNQASKRIARMTKEYRSNSWGNSQKWKENIFDSASPTSPPKEFTTNSLIANRLIMVNTKSKKRYTSLSPISPSSSFEQSSPLSKTDAKEENSTSNQSFQKYTKQNSISMNLDSEMSPNQVESKLPTHPIKMHSSQYIRNRKKRSSSLDGKYPLIHNIGKHVSMMEKL